MFKKSMFLIAAVIFLPSLLFAQYQVGTQFSDFTLNDINGQQVSLSDYQGKTILLNFYTTW